MDEGRLYVSTHTSRNLVLKIKIVYFRLERQTFLRLGGLVLYKRFRTLSNHWKLGSADIRAKFNTNVLTTSQKYRVSLIHEYNVHNQSCDLILKINHLRASRVLVVPSQISFDLFYLGCLLFYFWFLLTNPIFFKAWTFPFSTSRIYIINPLGLRHPNPITYLWHPSTY